MNLKGFLNKYHRVVLYTATLGLAAYGLTAIFNPKVLSGGFYKFTQQDWNQFQNQNHSVAAYVTLLWRLIGGFNLAAGLTLTFVVWKWLKPGQRWAWTTLLLGTLVAYLSPMSLDVTVRSIEFFEVIEFLLFGLFVAIMMLLRTEYFKRTET